MPKHLDAKLKRQKRIKRRGESKRWSDKSLNSGPSPLINIDEIRERAARTTPWSFAQNIPNTNVKPVWFDNKPLSDDAEGVPPRVKVLFKQDTLKNPVPKWKHLVLEQSKNRYLRLYFDCEFYFFVERVSSLKTIYRKSITYNKRKIAMFNYKCNSIRWILEVDNSDEILSG